MVDKRDCGGGKPCTRRWRKNLISRPTKAVQKVLGEISGAVIAITLLMTAVFVPVIVYDRSGWYILSPVLHHHGIVYRVVGWLRFHRYTGIVCDHFEKQSAKPRKKTWLNRSLDSFKLLVRKVTGKYVPADRIAPRRLVYARYVPARWGFPFANSLPTGFIPSEDQGMLYAIIQTPPGSTLERTENDLSNKLVELINEVEGCTICIFYRGLRNYLPRVVVQMPVHV